ncbi:MAG TPA: SRPBCC family protein [Burkholderiaceae bacterium]|nr:SRPBCC family protein [Burkholderiaceae bacterium]
MQDPTTRSEQPAAARYPFPSGHESDVNDRFSDTYSSYGAQRTNQIIRALGWFSVGLGLMQLFAPRTVSRTTGTDQHPVLLRALGARELASGVGILSQHKTGNWLWSRVAGDAMDLALLGIAARSSGARRSRLGWAAAAVASVTALDVISSVQRQRREQALDHFGGDVHVEKCITINRPMDECYRFWRNFENFPRFMQHVESVRADSENRSHWVVKAPAGGTVEWDAEVVAEEPGRLLAWRSVEGADVDHAGVVRFESAPGDRGTVVRVEMHYSPPGGMVGAVAARLFGEAPEQQIDDDLRHFKQLLETGEIPTTDGQPSGHRSPIARLLRKGAPG